VNVEWPEVVVGLAQALRAAGRIAAVISPQLTVEEAYLLATYVRGIDPNAVLVLGPVPVVGADETFPNGFTIHAEKAPNRRGVEAVIASFGSVTTWDDFLAKNETFGAVWLTGGYPQSPFGAEAAAKLSGVKTLVVQDCFASPVWEQATWQLPGATFAEREGSFVNYKSHLQSFRWAVRPPVGVTTEGQLYQQLLKRPGLYKAAKVLEDVCREIAFFAAATGGVSDVGVDLNSNKLAEETKPAAAAV
jgi:NADH-quinone oxidoreductase subunit G